MKFDHGSLIHHPAKVPADYAEQAKPDKEKRAQRPGYWKPSAFEKLQQQKCCYTQHIHGRNVGARPVPDSIQQAEDFERVKTQVSNMPIGSQLVIHGLILRRTGVNQYEINGEDDYLREQAITVVLKAMVKGD